MLMVSKIKKEWSFLDPMIFLFTITKYPLSLDTFSVSSQTTLLEGLANKPLVQSHKVEKKFSPLFQNSP